MPLVTALMTADKENSAMRRRVGEDDKGGAGVWGVELMENRPPHLLYLKKNNNIKKAIWLISALLHFPYQPASGVTLAHAA